MTRRQRPRSGLVTLLSIAVLLPAASKSRAQGIAPTQGNSPQSNNSLSLAAAVIDLQGQVRDLQKQISAMRADWEHERQEMAALRRHLPEVSAGADPHTGELKRIAVMLPEVQVSAEPSPQHPSLLADQRQGDHAAPTEEEFQLLAGKVDDQYQTKVESASKYRLRLSGIVLMNVASNQGVVDSIDLPTLAYARPLGNTGGSFGATLRQSEIGFDTFGPDILGARTRADLQLDLAGGFTAAPNGINWGLMRLRTGTLRLDWTNSSVVAGQDALFFSPTSPTSFASLSVPALSYAGNLWGWVPQVRVEHRLHLGDESNLLLQAGVLDPVSGETPGSIFSGASSYDRQPGPGESARQPGYAARVAWTRDIFAQTLRIGAGGYYNRQDYGFNRRVKGWAVITDFDLPLSHKVFLSGKLYRGTALGGLYGGIGRSVLFSDDPALPTTGVLALNTVGGWAQIKYRPANKWEFNLASGIDNPFARDLKYYTYARAYGDPTLARNQASFINVIYRPKSDLLLSAEYRRLSTKSLSDGINGAGHLNLMVGVLF